MQPISSIKVGVRARPLVDIELRDGCQSCVSFPGGNDIIIGGTKQFTFDHVFSDQATQEEIYNISVREMIKNLFLGYNVTVMAYGQTGSGKTFTMGTNCTENYINMCSGVIPRAIKDIYDYLDEIKENSNVNVKVSFIEVYKEDIFDLLSANKVSRQIREGNQDIKIQDLVEQTVYSFEDIFKCLAKGSENRAVGSTAMNETSSRSHAIFTIYISIEGLAGTDPSEAMIPITSKLHLVDLAGTERAGKTLATGDRFKEGVNINKGLLALGKVINSLVKKDKSNKGEHIPFRDSKLTRLLQDSLGGNTKTLMLACISPADSNFEETKSTLEYAAQARDIKNRPVINKVDSAQGEINQLRAQVTALTAQLRNIQNNEHPPVATHAPSIMTSPFFSQIFELKSEIDKMRRQKLELIEEFDEELAKKDELLKKAWDKLNVDSETEKDDTFLELEMAVKDIIVKEEQLVNLDQSEHADQSTDETKPESKEKNHTLKRLNDELKHDMELLRNAERADMIIVRQLEEDKRELQQRIKDLEEEKSRSNPKIRQDEVESRLKEARKQLHELTTLKKEREQNSNEVRQLRLKIDELKKSICKVTKELEKEKLIFRKKEAEKDRQYRSLLNKDRLLQTQIERDSAKHAKKTAVLLRKIEMTNAEKKRLKDKYENQMKPNTIKTSHLKVNRNISKQVKLWIRQSLERAADRCETRQRFNSLIEERRKMNEQLAQITESSSEEKTQLEAEIRQVNECISQLQQVELTEGSQDIHGVACYSLLKNIGECRIAIKFMFKQLVEERVNYVMAESELQQARITNTTLEQVNGILHTELEQAREDNKKQVERSLARRKSTMIFNSAEINRMADSSTYSIEPPYKRQKTSSRFSDNESVSSSTSYRSRQSVRISQSCRCKNGCKPSRCGCLKSNASCSPSCNCKSNCQPVGLTDIIEHPFDMRQRMTDDEAENIFNRTITADPMDTTDTTLSQTILYSKNNINDLLNTTFEIINDEDEDKENHMTSSEDNELNETVLCASSNPKDELNSTFCVSNKIPSQKKYFDNPSLIYK